MNEDHRMNESVNAIRAEYEHDPVTGRISQPGKFENEPIFGPHYWNLATEGFHDGDDGRVFTFKFHRDCVDFVNWPELKRWLGRKRTLRMSEDSQGFVRCF